MTIIGFIGGLASQMNNYAFLLAMKRRYPHETFKMANACFDHNGFELDRVFGIRPDWADQDLVQHLSNFHIGPRCLFTKACNAFHRIHDLTIGPNPRHHNMTEYSDPQVCLSKYTPNGDNVFWGNCTDVTFPEINDEFLRTMRFALPLDEKNRKMADQMSMEDSVSIHLRRGDYAKCGFPLLGNDYYSKAIRLIKDRVNNPTFYIFSNDLACAKKMFAELPNVVFVSSNRGNDNYKDMQLMSSCKHNIIANSGFSTMGALLNKFPEKIVVAPENGQHDIFGFIRI